MKIFINCKFFMLMILIKCFYYDNNTKYLLQKLLTNNTNLQNKPIYLSPNGKLKTLEYQGQTRLPTFIN